jgi:hypothetical protein
MARRCGVLRSPSPRSSAPTSEGDLLIGAFCPAG